MDTFRVRQKYMRLSVVGVSRYTRWHLKHQKTGFSMQHFYALILLLAVSTLGLVGCGNKGPLYLPPEPVQEVTAETDEPSEAIAPEESENTESE